MAWGDLLAVQWLRLCTSNAGGVGSVPDQRTKIPHAVWCGQKSIKKKKTKNLSWALRGVVLDSDLDFFHCSFMSNTGHVT